MQVEFTLKQYKALNHHLKASIFTGKLCMISAGKKDLIVMCKNRCILTGILIVFFSASALAVGISTPPKSLQGLYISGFGGANWVSSGVR